MAGKVDSTPPTKGVNSAKRKRVEDAVDVRQGDDKFPDTTKTMIDVAVVPLIFIAGFSSSKRSDRTLTGVTLEMEKYSGNVARVTLGISSHHA